MSTQTKYSVNTKLYKPQPQPLTTTQPQRQVLTETATQLQWQVLTDIPPKTRDKQLIESLIAENHWSAVNLGKWGDGTQPMVIGNLLYKPVNIRELPNKPRRDSTLNLPKGAIKRMDIVIKAGCYGRIMVGYELDCPSVPEIPWRKIGKTIIAGLTAVAGLAVTALTFMAVIAAVGTLLLALAFGAVLADPSVLYICEETQECYEIWRNHSLKK